MRRLFFIESIVFVIGLLLMPPGLINAQSERTIAVNPPISQPLIREGDFAIKLAEALDLGTASSETEAENMLGAVGIAPRNGWIADYPVTPDIIGELRKSISDAADSKRLSMEKDEALEEFQDVITEFNLAVMPYTPDQTVKNPEGYEKYTDPTVINNYYYNEGPPVVTYYPPPPDYYYLYSWVPYPFWWRSFWFPGFYCLIDFHRVVIVHKRVEVISNHFVDHKTNKVFRIDPVKRFNGKTFRGIGMPHGRKGFVSPEVQGGPPGVFGGSRERSISGPGPGSGKKFIPPSGIKRETSPPSNGGRTFTPRSGVKNLSPRSDDNRSDSSSLGGDKTIVPPYGRGRLSDSPSGGSGILFERGQRK